MKYLSALTNSLILILFIAALALTLKEGLFTEHSLNISAIIFELCFIGFYLSNIFFSWQYKGRIASFSLIVLNLIYIPIISLIYVVALNVTSQILAKIDPTAELQTAAIYGVLLFLFLLTSLFNASYFGYLFYKNKSSQV